MNRAAWLTPDAPAAASTQCWRLFVPAQFVEHMRGALGELSNYWNWEQAGNMTPQECADDMFASWLTLERCQLIGTVHDYFTAVLPDGVLLCDGTVYNRVDYPDLYVILDAAYIDDADTFHTPNLIDRVVMGGDTGETGTELGEAAHTLIVDEIPSHTHTIPFQSTFPYGNIPEVTVTGGLLTTSTGATGGDGAHNNVQPSTKALKGMIAR